MLNKMAASTGNLVFRVDNLANKIDSAGDDSDIWDDTALIKAYDKAINSFKGASGQCTEEELVDGKSKSKYSKNSKKHKKKKKRKNKWKVGDHCQAVFSEDGQLYDAVIKSINYKLATCWVTYAGYGNEEEHNIADLLASGDVDNNASAQENDYDSAMDYSEYSPHHPGVGSSNRPSSRNSHQHHLRATIPSWFTPQPPLPPHHMAAPFPPPPPPAWGMTPYQTPQFPLQPQFAQSPMPAGFPFVHMPHSANTSMGLPAVPPPPAPDADNEDESGIHSMLMSWYMSGYHTGYYQGLRQGKRISSSNTTEPKQGIGHQPLSSPQEPHVASHQVEPQLANHQYKPVSEKNDLPVASTSMCTEDETR